MGDAALDLDGMAGFIIAPSFDAVRDVFDDACSRLTGANLVTEVRLVINPDRHDTERHFAACATSGKRIEIAPEAADLPLETLTAILAHELGHASDFLNPGRWEFFGRDKPAKWVPDGVSPERRKAAQRRWLNRDDDEIEFWADAIAYAITGKKIGYCGPCLLQCFDGIERPRGLR